MLRRLFKIDNWADLVDSIVEVFHTLMCFLPMDCWESSILSSNMALEVSVSSCSSTRFSSVFWKCYVHKVEELSLWISLWKDLNSWLYSSLIHFTYYYSDRFILISLEWAITLILFTYLGINIQSAFLLRSIKLELDFYLSWQSLPFSCGIATYI